MAFTTFTMDDVTKLREAIAKGVSRVQYQDKVIVYNSFDDMKKALRQMEEELGLKKKSGRLFAESDKGLC